MSVQKRGWIVFVVALLLTTSVVSVVYASNIYAEPFELDVNYSAPGYPLQYAGKTVCKPGANWWNTDHKFYLMNATYEMRTANWKLYSTSQQGKDTINFEPIYGFFPSGQRPYICVGLNAMQRISNNPNLFASTAVAIKR